MKTPTITIVTSWKDHRELERDYFRAVFCVEAEHLIIDDGSDPPLPNALRNPKPGFTHAWNMGLEIARTDAVLFLNNDVVPREENWIEPIRDLLEPGVFVGAELRFDPHGMVDGEPMPYIDGWCLAGMRDELLELGGWDESYDEPAYYGDNDLSFRARMAGITLKEARVPLEHLRGRTVGGSHDTHTRAVTLANKAKFEARVRDALGVAA